MMRRFNSFLCLTVLLTAALILAGVDAASTISANLEQPLSEAEIFVELNHTDGDLGLHASIDGDAWTSLEIEGPREIELLNIVGRGRLQAQGLTQLFFESAEPPFDELAPADFFRRFPEGRYEIDARAQDGSTLQSIARLSHVLAAPTENITLSGIPAAENCDANPLPLVPVPVLIDWDPVTTSHPEVGKAGPIVVSRYQLFVEREGVKFSLDLPPDVTEFEIPLGVTALGQQFKFEIIVRTTTGNNTAIESCFRV